MSANSRGGWVSLNEARALGYEPRDDAEVYADEVLAREPADPDDPVFRYLGGEFTLPGKDVPVPWPAAAGQPVPPAGRLALYSSQRCRMPGSSLLTNST